MSSYAHAKGRVEPTPESEEQRELRRLRSEAVMAPLSEEEQGRARQNWNKTRALMPEFAEFIEALATQLPDFNGRRALAGMAICEVAPVEMEYLNTEKWSE